MEHGRSTSLRLGNKTNKLIPREIGDNLGKLPPQAIDMEEAVLGALMLEKNAITSALEASLKPEHFYDDRHKEIYEACLALFSERIAIDMRSMVAQLRKSGKIELIGGAYYIAELTSKVSSAANIDHHIRVIQEMFMRRELISIASQVASQAYEDTNDIFVLIENAETELFHMHLGRASQRKMLDMITLMGQAISELQVKATKSGMTGVPSGFSLLDKITSGWQKSDLIIVAARPGCGKTGFSLSAARTAAREIPTAFFSLEMAAVQLMNRLLSSENSIENDKIRTGMLSDEEWKRIGDDPSKLSSAKLYIDDTPAISINELRSKCLRLKQEKGIQLIIIDYLQLMRGDQKGNREQEISSITRGLKNLAKELDVPVIALSQLSRSVETRGGDKRPKLSDLRESGSIEQDADIVIFLYRAEYYKIFVDEDGNSTAGICEVDVAKHRAGGTGMVKVKFQKHYTRFIDLESEFKEPTNMQPPPKEWISKPEYDPSEARNKKDDETPF